MNLELQKGSRSKFLVAILLCIMTVFAVRLFYLQIIQHDHYVALANREQVKRLTIPSKRGVIYVLDGSTPVPIAMNQTIYTVFADPQIVKDDKKIIEVIKKVAGGNAKPNLQELLDRKDTRYQILATQITRTQAELIKKEELNGIGFQEGSKRVYPEGALASQILGFVDFDGIGRYGVEGKLNERLTGTDGMLQSVTDVSNVPLTIGDNYINTPAKDGDNIVLTIDRNIQSRVEQALSDGIARSGTTKASAIVMNPQTGEILAMANLPTYNSAEYNKVQDLSLFNNNVISAPYEPGSVFKTLTMATGIDKGVVTPESTYYNTDSIQVEDIVITNATLGHTGEITFQHALNWSLNTGFVTVAQRLGDGTNINSHARDTMYDYFHNKFHLGSLTNVEIDNEATGTIIPPTDVEGNAVRYSNMAFGQGVYVTMIQVAAAFSSIVNDGKYYQPTIISGVIDKDGKYIKNDISAPQISVSESTADQVREMTHVARNIFFERFDKAGYYIGGKTGTSEVIIDGKYSDDSTIATYLGFGGSEEESKYVIMVQVSGDGLALRGDYDAGPIFADISNWMIDYLKIEPKG